MIHPFSENLVTVHSAHERVKQEHLLGQKKVHME